MYALCHCEYSVWAHIMYMNMHVHCIAYVTPHTYEHVHGLHIVHVYLHTYIRTCTHCTCIPTYIHTNIMYACTICKLCTHEWCNYMILYGGQIIQWTIQPQITFYTSGLHAVYVYIHVLYMYVYVRWKATYVLYTILEGRGRVKLLCLQTKALASHSDWCPSTYIYHNVCMCMQSETL